MEGKVFGFGDGWGLERFAAMRRWRFRSVALEI